MNHGRIASRSCLVIWAAANAALTATLWWNWVEVNDWVSGAHIDGHVPALRAASWAFGAIILVSLGWCARGLFFPTRRAWSRALLFVLMIGAASLQLVAVFDAAPWWSVGYQSLSSVPSSHEFAAAVSSAASLLVIASVIAVRTLRSPNQHAGQ